MQPDRDKQPMLLLIEAIAYFLSGSFLVQTIYPHLAPQDSRDPMSISLNWLILGIGAVIIAVGFIAVSTIVSSTLARMVPVLTRRNSRLMTMSYRSLTRCRQWFEHSRPWMLAMVFSVSTTQLIPVLLNFGILPLSIAAVAFFFSVIIAIVFISWDILAKRADLLVQITLAFTAMSIIRVLQGANTTEILTILGAIFVFLVLTMLSIRRVLPKQLPLTKVPHQTNPLDVGASLTSPP